MDFGWTNDNKKYLKLLYSMHGDDGKGVTLTEESVDYVMPDFRGVHVVKVTTAAALLTVTLPTLADNQGSRVIVCKDKDSGVGEVRVDGEGAELLMYPGFTAAAGYVGLAGQSAEFVGMVDGWQWVSGVVQPVPGEPSLGTPHMHVETILSVDPADTNVHAVSLVGKVPNGTTWIKGYCGTISTTAGDEIYICDSGGTVVYKETECQVANQEIMGDFECPVDSSLNIYYKAGNARMGPTFLKMITWWS